MYEKGELDQVLTDNDALLDSLEWALNRDGGFGFDELALAISAFADALRAHPELYSQIDGVRRDSQSFDEPLYRDLQDFAERVAAIPGAPAALVSAATAEGLRLARQAMDGQQAALAEGLHRAGVEIVSTGSTARTCSASPPRQD